METGVKKAFTPCSRLLVLKSGNFLYVVFFLKHYLWYLILGVTYKGMCNLTYLLRYHVGKQKSNPHSRFIDSARFSRLALDFLDWISQSEIKI